MKQTFKRVYIEITNRCNLSCTFCPKTQRVLGDMHLDQFTHVLDQAMQFTKYIYLHVKGEPLLHPELEAMLEECRKRQLLVTITTNGTLLKRRLHLLAQAGCIRQINISLHSLDANPGYDFSHYLTDIIDSVTFLSEHTNINSSIRIWNVSDFDMEQKTKTAHMIARLEHAFSVRITPEIIFLGKHGLTLRPGIFLNMDHPFEWPDLNNSYCQTIGTCYGLRQQFAVLYDGTVIPCCLDGEGVVNLGNIFQQDLKSILSSQRVQNIVKGFQNRSAMEQLCMHCSYKDRFSNNASKNH